MLEKLEIGNFKAFGDIQTIDLKPLTLLFGANSAGKSTILQSLIYLSEAFKQRNWDIYSTQQGGEFIDFGGLQNIVHQKDSNNIVHFGLTVSGFTLLTPADIFNVDQENTNELFESLLDKNLKGSRRIQQSDLAKHQVPNYECTFTVRFGIHPDTSKIEYFSITEEQAVFITYSDNEPVRVNVEAEGEIFSVTRINKGNEYDVEVIKPFSRFFLKNSLLNESSKNEISDFIDPVIDKETFETELIEQIKKAGLEFDDDQFIAFWINDEDENWNQSSWILKLINKELNNLNAFFGFDENIDDFIYPVGNKGSVRNFTSKIKHIGYFRPVPERFIYKSGNNQTDDIWRVLLDDISLREQVNEYLSEPDKMDMGYKLEVHNWVSQQNSSRNTRSFNTLEIRDLHNDTAVNLRELGLGVIQTIPMLASLFDHRFNLVSIEQPELHLHPGLQSRIGKIFADVVKEKPSANFLHYQSSIPSKQLLIETHSEHIVKAIQLEVAKQDGLDPDQVNILYVQKDHEKPQSIVRKLSLDESGSFTEPWPDDFFELSADLTMERLKNIQKGRN